MAEANPSIQPYSPMQAAAWQNAILSMNNTSALSSHVPEIEIDENFQANEKARINAAIMNDMIANYWSPDVVPSKLEMRDGTYVKDGGIYTVEDGRVTSITTATGLKFSDIKYDLDGRVLSLRTPEGYRWEQRTFVGADGMLKCGGYTLHLSNLKLHYDRLLVDSKGITHMNTSRPGYVSTTTIAGDTGTMHIGKDGAMSKYLIANASVTAVNQARIV